MPKPRHNQVADQIGGYCTLSTQHPDWFLLDGNGNPIILEGNYVAMDPGHLGWRVFFLERARQSQEQLGLDGVFLDNVWASIEKRVNPDARPAAYPDADSYQAAVAGFLDHLYTGYFHPRARPLLANISLRDDAVWFRYLQYVDGALVE